MVPVQKLQAVGVAALVGVMAHSLIVQTSSPTYAQKSDPAEAQLKPVETDMHEYMEYIHQPTYRKLRQAMKEKPEGDDGWLAIKSGALILSESGNLLLLRGPKQNRDDWKAHAVDVREAGAKLYRAAHDKNFEQASAHYRSMLNECNSCHQQFAGGKHQLAP